MEDTNENVTQKKYNKFSIILMILIIIVAILIVLELTTGIVFDAFSNIKHVFFRGIGIELKEGNSSGNINNYGYIAEDTKYIYYMCPNENGKYIGISKVSKKDVTGKQERLIEGNWEIASISSYGNYIYFVTLLENNVDNKNVDKVDNQIHRIKKDGSKHEIINDNEFNNYSYKISVVDNKVYYIGDDECIWYMDLNGKHKTRLNENATGFELVTDKYIIYNMTETSASGEISIVTYIMDRDGKNARKISDERLYTSVIYDDYIYYLTLDRYLHRKKIDGKEDEMLSDNRIFNLNVSEDGIFYFDYKYNSENKFESMSICRMDLDGKNNKELHKLEKSSNSLCITKDWVFYLDSNDDQGRMELISFDGVQKIILFALDYDNYYYLTDKDQNSDEQNNVENEVQNSTVEGNVITENNVNN
ncbi:MAG: DUF5050 domain-containing protein [Clostridia bacterium]|nr:DUF5050 domain-containing protein [Clostridia bacterium]